MRLKKTNSTITLTDMWKWNYIESTIHNVMKFFNYKETRPPILLSNEVIKKIYSAGENDEDLKNLVSKLFQIDSNEELSLRPDGTVTYLSQFKDWSEKDAINRIYYIGPMFRRDSANPQLSGQFHQFGAEALGSCSYIIDIEIIRLGLNIFKKFGLNDITLELSNFGCKECRPSYLTSLEKYWQKSQNQLCSRCSSDFITYKSEGGNCRKCASVWQESPSIMDFLCDSCIENFSQIKRALANLMIDFTVNPKLNMSFDYYNQVVFRYNIGTGKKAQYIGGGGRYDYLAQSITGKQLNAIGLSTNMEQLLSIMIKQNLLPHNSSPFSVFIMATHQDLEITLLQIVQELHDNEIKVVIGNTEPDYRKQSSIAESEGSALMVILDNKMIREGKTMINNLVKNHKEVINISDLLNHILRLKKALTNGKD